MMAQSFTLASLGTILLDVFENEDTQLSLSPLSLDIPLSRVDSPSPTSSTSSVPESYLMTPTSPFGTYATLPRPSSFDCLPSPRLQARPPSALGGGGLYALIGARVWLAPHEMRAVIDAAPEGEGDADFPALQAEMGKFGTDMWVLNCTPGVRFPRAKIGYQGDVRTYQHIEVPQVRSGEEVANGPLSGAAFLHVSPPYGPAELLDLLPELQGSWRPKIAFEPAPSACHPGERDNFERAANYVDILSPNHEELLAFYGLTAPDCASDVRLAVERVVKHLLHSVSVGANGDGIVLIRCGPLGACVGTRVGGLRWTPSYWAHGSLRVKDVTGAGNAFIGGYIAGLKLTNGNPYEAALYASVSSSFVVEQFGLPALTSPLPSPSQSPVQYPLDSIPFTDLQSPPIQNVARALRLCAAKGREMWNSDSPQRRLELLRARAAVSA